jgi:hypothetical protein
LVEEPPKERDDLSYLYSKTKVNILRKDYQEKEGIKYDWIITMRYDTLLISYDLDFSYLEKRNIYILEEPFSKDEYSNIFTLCDNATADSIFSLYYQLNEASFRSLVLDICEKFWTEYLKKLNIPIIKIKLLEQDTESF